MTQTYTFINPPTGGTMEPVEGANRAEGIQTGWLGAAEDAEWQAEQADFLALAEGADDEALAADD